MKTEDRFYWSVVCTFLVYCLAALIVAAICGCASFKENIRKPETQSTIVRAVSCTTSAFQEGRAALELGAESWQTTLLRAALSGLKCLPQIIASIRAVLSAGETGSALSTSSLAANATNSEPASLSQRLKLAEEMDKVLNASH